MPVVVCVLATLTYWSVDKNSSCHDHDRHRQILILFPFISTVSAGKKYYFSLSVGFYHLPTFYEDNHDAEEEDGKEKDAKEENDKEDDDKEDDNEKDNKEEEEDDEDNEEEDEEEVEDDNK